MYLSDERLPTGQCAYRVLGAVVFVTLLSACAGISRTEGPAQVEDRSSAPPPAQPSEPQITAYIPPAQAHAARPAPKRAVAVLTRRAEDQRSQGDLDGATVSLERALRIAPEDAVLWHRLAQVRQAQSRHDLVVQLAAKSNSLAAPGDRALRSDNWQLIAEARRALGDAAGARSAQARADSLR
jgi:cytochrome c-type biogenesis protein CcmH/NrfG